jgi:tetratricopeptide (TPR) repeat protein
MELHQEISDHRKKIESVCEELLREMRSKALEPEFIRNVTRFLPLILDFGKVTQGYELCEFLISRWQNVSLFQQSVSPTAPLHSPSMAFLFCRIYKCHIDISRKKELASHRRFVESLRDSPHAWLRAQAFSALGFLDVLEGKNRESLPSFEEAIQLFEMQGDTVGILKVRIRKIYALFYLWENEKALEEAKEVLERALKTGVAAVSPILAAYGAIGHNYMDAGRHSDGLRSLREAAKISKLMAPSHAGAFAIYQYGYALCRTGRHKEAIVWLDSAEKMQRMFDPVMRHGTLTVLLNALRLSGDLSRAVTLSKELISDRLLNIHIEDQLEAYEEAIQVELARHCLEGAQQLLQNFMGWCDRNSVSELDKETFRAKLDTHIQSYIQHWTDAHVLLPLGSVGQKMPNSSLRVFIDFENRSVMALGGRHSDGVAEIKLTKDSGIGYIFWLLYEARDKQAQNGVGKDQILEKLSTESPDTHADSIQRRFRRALSVCLENGLLEEVRHEGQFFYRFPNESEIHVRKFKSVNPPASLLLPPDSV